MNETKNFFILNFTGLHGMVGVNFTIPASDIDLWWPNGYGEQILYRLKLEYADESIEKLIGFR